MNTEVITNLFRTNVDCGDKDDIETEPEVLEPKVSIFSNFRLLIFDILMMFLRSWI